MPLTAATRDPGAGRSAWPIVAAPAADDAGRRAGRSTARRPAARCSISCAPAASRGSASTAARRAVAAAGALVHYLRTTQKVDLAHVRAIGYRAARRRAAHRSDDAEAPRDPRGLRGRPRRVAARRARSHGHRRSAAGCCASWLLRPLLSLERDPRSARRGRGAGVPHDRARQVPRRAQDASRTSSGSSRAPRSAPPARAICVGLKQSLAVIPRVRTVLAELQAPLVRSLVAELDDLADVRDRDRAHAHRRSAGARARRRLHARRRRRRARRAADDQPLRQAGHRRDGGARARAHRHRVAEGPLQPRLRLLHRDLEVEPARGAAPTTTASRRSPAASASSRRR